MATPSKRGTPLIRQNFFRIGRIAFFNICCSLTIIVLFPLTFIIQENTELPSYFYWISSCIIWSAILGSVICLYLLLGDIQVYVKNFIQSRFLDGAISIAQTFVLLSIFGMSLAFIILIFGLERIASYGFIASGIPLIIGYFFVVIAGYQLSETRKSDFVGKLRTLGLYIFIGSIVSCASCFIFPALGIILCCLLFVVIPYRVYILFKTA